MIEVSIGDVIAIVLGLGAFIVALVAFFRANPNATPAAIDAEVTRRLQEQQANREYMDRLERVYQQNNDAQRRVFDTFVAALRIAAPFTPITSDDEAVKLLTDVQTPGAPAAG